VNLMNNIPERNPAKVTNFYKMILDGVLVERRNLPRGAAAPAGNTPQGTGANPPYRGRRQATVPQQNAPTWADVAGNRTRPPRAPQVVPEVQMPRQDNQAALSALQGVMATFTQSMQSIMATLVR
jgi:hypothetical protein